MRCVRVLHLISITVVPLPRFTAWLLLLLQGRAVWQEAQAAIAFVGLVGGCRLSMRMLLSRVASWPVRL
jgi:hypothetical protein